MLSLRIFLVDSDAREEIVRRAAFRLIASTPPWASHAPAHGTPTRIVLVRSSRNISAQPRLSFVNPAFFDRDRQEIAPPWTWNGWAPNWPPFAAISRRERLRGQERAWPRTQGNVPQRQWKSIGSNSSRSMSWIAPTNDSSRRPSRRFFETLYHEACHAYVDLRLRQTRSHAELATGRSGPDL